MHEKPLGYLYTYICITSNICLPDFGIVFRYHNITKWQDIIQLFNISSVETTATFVTCNKKLISPHILPYGRPLLWNSITSRCMCVSVGVCFFQCLPFGMRSLILLFLRFQQQKIEGTPIYMNGCVCSCGFLRHVIFFGINKYLICCLRLSNNRTNIH